MNLTDFFISAPLSALFTFLIGVSMLIVFDEVGKRIFKCNEIWVRAMYFFTGLLFFSWIVFIISALGYADTNLFPAISVGFFLLACFFVFSKGVKFYYHSCFPFRLSNSFSSSVWQRLFTYSVILIIIIFVLVTLSPPTDDDSLDYHLGLPVEILRSGKLMFNPDFLHFRLFGFGEMINLFGLGNGCIQLGAFIQLLAFFWLIMIFYEAVPEKSKNLVVSLLLGLPVLLFLLPNQKHQLTGICATTISFFVISKYSSLLRRELLFLLSSCIIFSISLKYSFLISAVALVVLFMMKKATSLRFFLSFLFLLGIIFLGPLMAFKYLRFDDPLSPLLEGFLSQPDPVIIAFRQNLRGYAESHLPFPASILIPASFGNISTVLGWGAVIIVFAILFLFRKKTPEIFTIIIFIALTILGGQKTSRFFVEPYFWILPSFILLENQSTVGKLALAIGKIQFLLLIPFWLFALYLLSPGIVSNKQRDRVMATSSNGYSASQWMDEVLPPDAKIAATIRSRSLLPRTFFPYEYILFSDYLHLDSLRVMLKDRYQIDYLVVPNDKLYSHFKERFAGDLFKGPEKMRTATRNPFNKREFELSIYKLK